MATDNPGGILSFSWGACDLYESDALRQVESAVYQKAAGAGISILNSTGDSGAYRCMDADWGAPPTDKNLGVELPSSYTLGVTAVGGTRLSVRQDGTYYEEIAWSEPLITGGGGGGLSRWYPQPDWQKGPNVTNNQYNPSHKRMVPDVSADADPTTGMTLYMQGGLQQGGGTSQAAPLWAGLTALINQYLKKKGLKPVGFMNMRSALPSMNWVSRFGASRKSRALRVGGVSRTSRSKPPSVCSSNRYTRFSRAKESCSAQVKPS